MNNNKYNRQDNQSPPFNNQQNNPDNQHLNQQKISAPQNNYNDHYNSYYGTNFSPNCNNNQNSDLNRRSKTAPHHQNAHQSQQGYQPQSNGPQYQKQPQKNNLGGQRGYQNNIGNSTTISTGSPVSYQNNNQFPNNNLYTEDYDRTISEYTSRYKDNNRYASQQSNASLIIIDNTRTIRTEELTSDEITIGRLGDIIISSAIVSKSHGKFSRINNQYYYEDCGSLNGTLLNGVQIQEQPNKPSRRYALGNGDVLKVEIENSINSIENIMVIFSTQSLSHNNWQFINLYQRNTPLLIGRAVPDGNLQLNSMQVSKKHAQIFSYNGGFMLQDLNSLNGICVNGKRIRGNYPLYEKDVISIGSTKIIFTNGNVIFNTDPNGVKVDVQDISRVVKGNKTILSHVTLTINPCELVAIIGGSGAGKSTFMNCVNGFEPATSGRVIMDNLNLYSNYNTLKSRIGYVPQKDELHDFLTVKQALIFTAQLRLNNDVKKQELKSRVDNVLKIMDLSDHRKTMIKKLSGGQKKRVSIAMELVSDPDIFFLDEPTSGLDPETETALMKQLKHLSSSIGKTIVVITHTLQNIHLFDKIIFLGAGGKLCYYGTPKEALDFFGVEALPEAYEKIKNNVDYFVNKYNNQKRGGKSE